MTDPYRLTDPQNRPCGTPSGSRTDIGTALIWLLLVVSASANSVASLAAAPLLLHLGLGLATATCVGLLVARYRRGRR